MPVEDETSPSYLPDGILGIARTRRTVTLWDFLSSSEVDAEATSSSFLPHSSDSSSRSSGRERPPRTTRTLLFMMVWAPSPPPPLAQLGRGLDGDQELDVAAARIR